MSLAEKIKALQEEVRSQHAKNHEEVEALRIKYLSKKGIIPSLFEEFKSVPNEEKRTLGALINEVKTLATEHINALRDALQTEETAEHLDLSRSAYPASIGGRHPLTLVREEIIQIFAKLGFSIALGPEVEDDYHVFSALNFAPDHPARDMQDTFFVERNPDVLLRTHTSSVQVRVMQTTKPPIRVICPGRVYRNEAISARAHCFFHQIEGLAVDKGLTMADMKGTLEYMARAMFGEEARIRLRPNFFPFTEPSAELDLWHPNAKGGPQWIEWGGCGMVNPNVLRAAGIDPEIYSGFAFGMGIERTLMFRNNVPDMHDMIEGDIRFSEQFGMEI